MIAAIRLGAPLAAALMLTISACGGDDVANPPTASPVRTIVIGPEEFTFEEALAELDNIEEMIRNPDADLVSQFEIDTASVDKRITDTFEGVQDAPGLNEVRRLLTVDRNRILAGETLYNITFAAITPAFGSGDTGSVPPEEIAELDPLHVWAVDPEDGLPTTTIWADAVARIIFLWYRL